MNGSTLKKTLGLGAITGMRSMSGAAAVAAAHLAYHARKRMPLSNPMGGLLEDAAVLALGAFLAPRGLTGR